jgi:hypothetical protein
MYRVEIVETTCPSPRIIENSSLGVISCEQYLIGAPHGGRNTLGISSLY